MVSLALLGVAAVSRRLAGTPITPAILFVGFGLLVGPTVLGGVDLSSTDSAVRVLAEAGPLRNAMSAKEGGIHYWLLATPELQHILVAEQGWSHDRYEAWLREALEAVLLP